MIQYETYTLANGLTVILHHAPERVAVAVNVLYKVGSRNDPPDRTGLAHLFEHLMFTGSEQVPDFDGVLQMAGGENNAITSADTTLYYDVLPASNVETALWLEADRMRKPNLHQHALDTQKKVVIEEFRETCLEQPYGDLYHHLNGLIFRVHPYRWPVIGSRIDHIAAVSLADVRAFHARYYQPDNAILSIAGGFDPASIREQVDRWFGPITATPGRAPVPDLPPEPPQTALRHRAVRADVPSPVIYRSYRTPGLQHPDSPAIDMLCFLLGGGYSSFLYRRLVRDSDLFTEVSASPQDNLDAGAILIDARPAEDADYGAAHAALCQAIEALVATGVTAEQREKVLNHIDQHHHYKTLGITHRATELAFAAVLGDIDLVNKETQRYQQVTVADINRVARTYLRPERCSELEYLVEEE